MICGKITQWVSPYVVNFLMWLSRISGEGSWLMRQSQYVVLWMSDKFYELYHQTSSWRHFSSVRELCWLMMLRSKLVRATFHSRRLEPLSPSHNLLYRVFDLQWYNLSVTFDSLNAFDSLNTRPGLGGNHQMNSWRKGWGRAIQITQR